MVSTNGRMLSAQLDGQIGLAGNYLAKAKASPPTRELVIDLFKQFPQEPTNSYDQLATEFETMMRLRDLSKVQQSSDTEARGGQSGGQYASGYVKYFKSDKGYGFIAHKSGAEYFFHLNSVADANLTQMLNENPQSQPQVRFLAAKGR